MISSKLLGLKQRILNETKRSRSCYEVVVEGRRLSLPGPFFSIFSVLLFLLRIRHSVSWRYNLFPPIPFLFLLSLFSLYFFIVPRVFVAENDMAVHLSLSLLFSVLSSIYSMLSSRNFSFSVVRQKYEVQVRDAYVLAGNTGVLRCEIPAFVKEYVAVTSWLKDSAFNIYPSAESGEYNYRSLATYMRTKYHVNPGYTHFPDNDGCRTFSEKPKLKTRFLSMLLPDIFLTY